MSPCCDFLFVLRYCLSFYNNEDSNSYHQENSLVNSNRNVATILRISSQHNTLFPYGLIYHIKCAFAFQNITFHGIDKKSPKQIISSADVSEESAMLVTTRRSTFLRDKSSSVPYLSLHRVLSRMHLSMYMSSCLEAGKN
jgi:hypothetical protein